MIDFIKKQAGKILAVFIALYVFLFSFLSFKKYYNFYYNGLDLSIFNQLFYNTVQGRWFEVTFNLNNYLADHFTPIVTLILPFYYLWPDPRNLLIIQTLILALCAWPIYLIAYKVLNNKLISLFISLLWLINFLLHNGNLFEFHLIPLAIFFILWIFYFYYTNNFRYFLLFFVLALLVREDISLILLGFLPLSIIDKRSFKWLITSLFSIVYFLLSLQIISLFNFGESNKFLLYYSWLGGDSLSSILLAWLSHPIIFISHIFNFSNLFNFLVILLSLGLISLIACRYLWLLFFPLAQLLLTSQGLSNSVFNMHYGLLFLPALFISFIFAVYKIVNREKFLFSKLIYSNIKLFILLLIVTALYFSYFLSPFKNVLLLKNNTNYQNIVSDFISLIPQDSDLVVSSTLAPSLSSREGIYFLEPSYLSKTQFYLHDFTFPEVDYILIDTEDILEVLSYYYQRQNYFNTTFSELRVPGDFRERLEDYNLIKAHNNLLLWQHKKFNNAINLPLYSFEDNLNYDSKYIIGEDYNTLILNYKKTQDNNYLIRFYSNNYYYDVPLYYGLYFDLAELDNVSNLYYYLDKDIYSYQIFTWRGEAKLGELRAVSLDLNLTSVTDIIYLDDL